MIYSLAMSSDLIIARARAAVGTPFRLHGRSVTTGLDCVGLIAFAHGRDDEAPVHYALRTTQLKPWVQHLDQMGERVGDWREAGATLLLRAGPAQVHLGLWTGTSLIHAHAGLRRTVETPGWPGWPLIGAWRITARN